MDDTIAIAKALADRTRLRILMALTGGELCVCQIVELCSLAPSTISKHLQLLNHAGLIDARKDGRWIYYRLAEKGAPDNVRGALKWVRGCFSDDAAISADRKKLEKITAKDKEALCRIQAKR
jgi:DNA-binding transcriptional ArsR family regulator